MSIKVSPSILAADFGNIERECNLIDKSDADWFHLDVMDGIFVPNISFGMPVVKAIRKMTSKPLDVHLMITEPERYIEKFIEIGSDIISFHIEATNDPVGIIHLIRSCGSKVGVSIKPTTPLSDIFPILDKVDVVLIMSVEPGFGGQGYLPGSNERISEIRKYLNEKCLDRVLIEVDGGIKLHNAKEVIDAGANVLVAGSEIFKANNPIQTIKDFYQLT